MKIQLNVKAYPPSRACEGTAFAVIWAREGVSERQWRSAANRPSRQARPGVGCTLGGSPFSAESGNKKEGRSIVYSPAGWYDNAPTLLRCGCAALKAVELRSTPRKLLHAFGVAFPPLPQARRRLVLSGHGQTFTRLRRCISALAAGKRRLIPRGHATICPHRNPQTPGPRTPR